MAHDANPSFLSANKPAIEAVTGERFVNYLIDFIAFLFFYNATIILLATIAFNNGQTILKTSHSIIDLLFKYLLYVIFYFFSEGASHGRSLGKLVTRTKAVKQDGSAITWEDAFMRSLCRLIPFEQISAFTGVLWHDDLTKTKVIKII